ncbi:MAG: RHS repeat-associated core domain-containing protein [Candidatus Kapabacteria bacterium]|nr:RHS repeat-associated core domain-containing protein [Candidatus Kapabacteria bacterium]
MWNNSHREYASPDAISYDPQKWLWQYRKGAFDTREQKRLLISPHGDGTDDLGDDYAHLWEYSLSGVAGELYVLYKGLQTATTTEPNENKTDVGRRVYISPFKYYAAGGELQFQADGTTKEVHITDNLGSVRSIVIWDSGGLKDIKSFDYKPFGELDGGDEPTKHGFATAEYDGESSCFAMGMRMYSAELGRFLSVDPLFEAMPRHTPYHYSFNSPLVWKDPSGLMPENEKDQDRLMALQFPDLSESNYHIDSYRFEYEIIESCSWGNLIAAHDAFIDDQMNRGDNPNGPPGWGGGGGAGGGGESDGRTGGDGSGTNGSGAGTSGGGASGGGNNGSGKSNKSDKDSKDKKGVSKIPYASLQNFTDWYLNFIKSYSIEGTVIVEAERPRDLTKDFNTHLTEIDRFFRRFNNRLLPGSLGLNLNILPFGVIQFMGHNSDFLNLKQTAKYKRGGMYEGKYFEGDDFGNYAYGVAAKASGVHLHEALMGGGAFGIWKGSHKNWWNIIGFTDEWKDSKMIIRGYFHSYKKFIEGK